MSTTTTKAATSDRQQAIAEAGTAHVFRNENGVWLYKGEVGSTRDTCFGEIQDSDRISYSYPQEDGDCAQMETALEWFSDKTATAERSPFSRIENAWLNAWQSTISTLVDDTPATKAACRVAFLLGADAGIESVRPMIFDK